jgi:hypothetical protein
MEELKKWLNENYYALLSQSEQMGFQQAFDTIRLKIQDLIDAESKDTPKE